MQYKNATKIIIDKRKLDILIRLGCPDNQILQLLKTGKFTPTGDSLIDETLECLVDFKEFKNWGGNHNPKGINGCNKNKKRSQVDQQVDSQDDCQVVDKNKDIDIEEDKERKIEKNNRYGECGYVLLTEEQYERLSAKNDNFDIAVEKLDTWLGTSGSKYRNKNHYAYFKSNSWVWNDLKKKELMF